MLPHYTYTPSPDFINQLDFDHVETYSFQRGVEYETQQNNLEQEYELLKSRKAIANDLTVLEVEKLSQLEKYCDFTQYLIDENYKYHFSAEKINTFASTDNAVMELKTILNTPIKAVPSWMCAPVYRDAVVFFDSKHSIAAVLNVCLSCQYMETAKFSHIQADYLTYEHLTRFFIRIGHQVDDTE
jgi:hypothetical protein